MAFMVNAIGHVISWVAARVAALVIPAAISIYGRCLVAVSIVVGQGQLSNDWVAKDIAATFADPTYFAPLRCVYVDRAVISAFMMRTIGLVIGWVAVRIAALAMHAA